MNLVIIHYHLNRGGVTSVIRNQINALAGTSPVSTVLVLHGGGTQGWPESQLAAASDFGLGSLSFEVIPGLGYQTDCKLDEKLHELLWDACHRHGLEPQDTLIQVHNHCLGKNGSLMVAVSKLADRGFRILLQIHDFAEDLRPGNYVAIQDFCRANGFLDTELEFPDRPSIHYAFLNQRDVSLIADQYIPASRCHFLPNPVSVQPLGNGKENGRRQNSDSYRDDVCRRVRDTMGCKETDRLVVYPVRAIRRKNVAEAILFAVTHANVRLAITLPAVSPEERPAYENIKRYSKEHDLPVCFEAGQQGLEFADLIESADFIFSSSVAEGFGMVFLESWCWGHYLIGRNLPGITQDFIGKGLNLDHLYREVKIPLGWFDFEQEVKVQQELLSRVQEQFKMTNRLQLNLGPEKEQGWIDFSKLSHRTQLQTITSIRLDQAKRDRLLALNPKFQLPDPAPDLVSHNANIVLKHFTAEAFRDRFREMSRRIFDGSEDMFSQKETPRTQKNLVSSFLDPQQFVPLRVESE